MTTKIIVENATVNIFLEINGIIHLVAMERDKLDAISTIVKQATDTVISTGKSQPQLNAFLGYGG